MDLGTTKFAKGMFMNTTLSEEHLLSQAWNMFAKDDYAGVLNVCRTGYAQGVRSYDLVRLMLDSLNKLGKFKEQADVTVKVLKENEYPPKVAAKLYFRAGLIFQQQEELENARETFQKVHDLDPAFPGIVQRIKALAPRPVAARSRYSYLLDNRLLSGEQLSHALLPDIKDPDALIMNEYKVSKADLGKSLSQFYNAEFVPFSTTTQLPFELFEKRRLDPDFLKRYGWVPFSQSGNTIVVSWPIPLIWDAWMKFVLFLELPILKPRYLLLVILNSLLSIFINSLGLAKNWQLRLMRILMLAT